MRASALIVVATWAILLTGVAEAQASKLGSRVLQAGATGDDVTELQRDLAAVGFDPGTADGDFGGKTERAVRSFQASAKLTVDGIVGPATVQALEAKLAALASAPSPAPSQPAPVSQQQQQQQTGASTTTCSGIDVSSWEGAIDWDAVQRAGIQFAFARASDGASYEDSQFQTYWDALKAHGIVRGAYQYFRASQDPVAQADLLAQKIGTLLPGDLPPVLDCETLDGQDAGTFVTNMRAWIDRIQAKTGLKPLIYATRSFWHDELGEPTVPNCGLWVANWGVSEPKIPDQWSDWLFWQTTDKGTVAGIGGSNCDLDVFHGSLADLVSWANGQVPTPSNP